MLLPYFFNYLCFSVLQDMWFYLILLLFNFLLLSDFLLNHTWLEKGNQTCDSWGENHSIFFLNPSYYLKDVRSWSPEKKPKVFSWVFKLILFCRTGWVLETTCCSSALLLLLLFWLWDVNRILDSSCFTVYAHCDKSLYFVHKVQNIMYIHLKNIVNRQLEM